MTDASGSDDDLDVLACEYVMGLLDDGESRRFEERVTGEPALARALSRARERFLEIDTSARPVAPTDGLWSRIEQSLDAPSNVVGLNAHRNENRRATSQQTAAVSPRRLQPGFWQGVAASLAVVIAAGLVWSMIGLQKPQLIVVLLDSQAQPVSLIEAYAGRKVRIVPLGRIDVPEGRTLQVWTLPNAATGPVSLGLLRAVTATTLEGPQLPVPQLNQLYEITLEPAGGSPTGRPTGPIIGKGYAKRPQI
ncbi:MAG: anti-sigma factor [Beijerinckiaceae bacterium]